MPNDTILINRAPVLTLWAAVVAEQLGFTRDEALSLGKVVAGLNAQAKGRALGIFKPRPERVKEARKRERGEEFWVELCGRAVPAKNTPDGVRAVSGDTPIGHEGVERYLEKKFGRALAPVTKTMKDLAAAFDAEHLADQAFSLYERFRPEIPRGKKGWGAKGVLDLSLVRSLAREV
jgi:hypothetical protein